MEILLTKEESEQYFLNALCNGLGWVEASYGLSLEFDDNKYQEAKLSLVSPCYEDVLIQILKQGGTLTLKDDEGDGDDDSVVTIQDVWDRVQRTPIRHLMDMINGNDDGDTADVIIQQVFFEEVVFG